MLTSAPNPPDCAGKRIAMTSRDDRIQTHRAPPRLYLVTPEIAEPAGLSDLLGSALAAAEVAAVLLRPAAADERTLVNRVKALAPGVQDRGVALLLAGHADIVARAGADGAHLSGIGEFQAALNTLKPTRIAGCGELATRHDAMLAGEAGADYVMFGEPDEDGRRPAFDAVLERIAWWAEIFEIPCIGFAASFEEVRAIVDAGADFVAIGDLAFADARGCAAAVAQAAQLIAGAEAAA
jgi:thiamine-phosphate pyrophosphorylase